MHYMLSAGEASGDIHGAALVKALRELDGGASFTFLGGDAMAAAAGHAPLVHIRSMAYMGFSEVLRHLPDVRANLRTARAALSEPTRRPDALILIDYPSFNFKLAEEAARHGIPVYYFIPPKVWAWKQWRIRTLRRLCSGIYSILPFEPEFYARHGMTVEYVGNPSVAEVDEAMTRVTPVVADKPILALVPGSRVGEIRCNLPVMARAAQLLADRYTPVIAAAPGIDDALYEEIAPSVHIYRDGSLELMASAEVALVTSGTATLECALAGTPQVACYRANGSRLSYAIMERLLSVRYVTLPNLILNDEAIPEMLLHRCTPELLADEVRALAPGSPAREAQLAAYGRMRTLLGNTPAARTAAQAILASLRR
ncbi:MAG: lipid-A-disaccharide synthase [Candidatus Amulumruptor caecigallinarius]|nr:lipid-A-disaccharide synthase [Candidatus Amulumruptor caecigallinarius]MCM1396374.1 lipid-A-disaccharide synthase [Candidatus Amulumruptor caecigallinarius]MCM1453684.1 lipid-A-disaccharide synthase [bacterium]